MASSLEQAGDLHLKRLLREKIPDHRPKKTTTTRNNEANRTAEEENKSSCVNNLSTTTNTTTTTTAIAAAANSRPKSPSPPPLLLPAVVTSDDKDINIIKESHRSNHPGQRIVLPTAEAMVGPHSGGDNLDFEQQQDGAGDENLSNDIEDSHYQYSTSNFLDDEMDTEEEKNDAIHDDNENEEVDDVFGSSTTDRIIFNGIQMPEPYPQKYKLGTKIQKDLDGREGLFEGTIINFMAETGFYKIRYDNGDEEDMDQDGITQQLSMYGSSNSGTTTPRCEILEVNWLEKYNRLRKFKDEYGHCRVPQGYHHDPSLGIWVQHQRALYNNSKLSIDRIKKLNKIGFDWSLRTQKWHEVYNRLKAFREKNGHCRVPYKYDPDQSLAIWVEKQRQCYRKDSPPMAADRFEKLNEIGFDWVVPRGRQPNTHNTDTVEFDKKWCEVYDRLKNFKDETGHCRVPWNYGPDQSLAYWVQNQRSFFKKSKLSPDRVEKLNKIGFIWQCSSTAENDQQVGTSNNINIDFGGKFSRDPNIDVQPSRKEAEAEMYKHHQRCMNGNTIIKLRGQYLAKKGKVWRYGCLGEKCNFKLQIVEQVDGPNKGQSVVLLNDCQHNHPIDAKEAPVEQEDCCQFCSNPSWKHKVIYKCGTSLSKYFPLSDNNPNPGWYEGTIKKHNVSTAEEESEQIWNEIHYDDGDIENLPQDEVKLLMDNNKVKILDPLATSNLGSNRSVHKPATSDMMNRKEINNEKWLEKYERLIEFKNKNGHCRVPHYYGPDPSLGHWVHRQRKLYKKDNPPMASDRIEILNQIGFDWAPREKQPTPYDTDTGTESPDQSWKMDEKLLQENVQAAIHHDRPEATNNSTETSHQVTDSDMAMTEECKASSSSGKQQRPSRTTLNDSDSVTTTGRESLSVALQHSLDSTKTMQEWDGKMGLNRHYSGTMLQSSKSREQLLAANVTGSDVSDCFNGGKVSAAAKPEQPTCVGKTGSSKSAAPSTQASSLSPLKQHPSESSPNQESITSVKPKEFHPPAEDTNCGQTVKAVAAKTTVTSLVGIVLKNHPEQGVFINSLTPTSIFRRSALRAGMKIISVNGTDCRLLDKVAVGKILKDYTGHATIWASIPVPTAPPPPDPATKKSGGMYPVWIRIIQRDNPLGGKRCPTAIADVRYNETIPKNTTLKDAYDNPAVIYRVRHVSRSTAELIANGTAEAVLALVDHKSEETIQVYPVGGLEAVSLLDIDQKCTPIDQKPEPITFLFYVQDKKKTPPSLSPEPEVIVIDD